MHKFVMAPVPVPVPVLVPVPVPVTVAVPLGQMAWSTSQKAHSAPCPTGAALGQAPRGQIKFSLVC